MIYLRPTLRQASSPAGSSATSEGYSGQTYIEVQPTNLSSNSESGSDRVHLYVPYSAQFPFNPDAKLAWKSVPGTLAPFGTIVPSTTGAIKLRQFSLTRRPSRPQPSVSIRQRRAVLYAKLLSTYQICRSAGKLQLAFYRVIHCIHARILRCIAG